MRVGAPLVDLLRYWRSSDPSIITFGWISVVLFVVPLVFLGWWGMPLAAALLFVFGYVFKFDQIPRWIGEFFVGSDDNAA